MILTLSLSPPNTECHDCHNWHSCEAAAGCVEMHVHDAQKWRQRFLLWVVLALDELGRLLSLLSDLALKVPGSWPTVFDVHLWLFEIISTSRDDSRCWDSHGDKYRRTAKKSARGVGFACRIDRIKQIVTRSPCPSWCNDGRGNNGNNNMILNKLDLHSHQKKYSTDSAAWIARMLEGGAAPWKKPWARFPRGRWRRSRGPHPVQKARNEGSLIWCYWDRKFRTRSTCKLLSSSVNFESNTVSSACEHGNVCGEL